MLAPKLPWMFGKATLTIVTSTISSRVAVTMPSVMSARRQPNSTTSRDSDAGATAAALPRASAGLAVIARPLDLDRGFDRHAGPQRIRRIRVIEQDAHGYALRHLHKVAGRVLRG